jgi:hypothetical protein
VCAAASVPVGTFAVFPPLLPLQLLSGGGGQKIEGLATNWGPYAPAWVGCQVAASGRMCARVTNSNCMGAQQHVSREALQVSFAL